MKTNGINGVLFFVILLRASIPLNFIFDAAPTVLYSSYNTELTPVHFRFRFSLQIVQELMMAEDEIRVELSMSRMS
jgi:hypothetical protein